MYVPAVRSLAVAFASALLMVASGCVSREPIKLTMPDSVKEALQSERVNTLFFVVERVGNPAAPELLEAAVLSAPNSRDDASLAAALPSYDPFDGTPLAISLVGYAAPRGAFGLNEDGPIISVAEAPLPPGAEVIFQARVSEHSAEGFVARAELPAGIASRKMLRATGCANFMIDTATIGSSRINFRATTAVPGGVLVSASTSTANPMFWLTDLNNIERVDSASVSAPVMSMAWDGEQVWAGDAELRLLRMDARGRLRAPPQQLGSDGGFSCRVGGFNQLSVAISAEDVVYAYDCQSIWQVSERAGRVVTTTVSPLPDEMMIRRVAAGRGGRLMVVGEAAGVPRAYLGGRGGWTEVAPMDSGTFKDASADDTTFTAVAKLRAWQRPHEGGDWVEIFAPALGPGPFHPIEYRRIAPISGGRLVVIGEAGVIDVRYKPTAPMESARWCNATTGSIRYFDGVTTMLDRQSAFVYSNADERNPSAVFVLVPIPQF